MSFWLELWKRHFHYCLSKCILLGAVKSMDACVWKRERRGRLLHLMMRPTQWHFSFGFYQSHDCSEPRDLEAQITSVNETSDDWALTSFSSHFYRLEFWATISYPITVNESISQNYTHSRWMNICWLCGCVESLNSQLHRGSYEVETVHTEKQSLHLY